MERVGYIEDERGWIKMGWGWIEIGKGWVGNGKGWKENGNGTEKKLKGMDDNETEQHVCYQQLKCFSLSFLLGIWRSFII